MDFSKSPVGGPGDVQVKFGMSIDSHWKMCVLVQTAVSYTLGKYVNFYVTYIRPYTCYVRIYAWPHK